MPTEIVSTIGSGGDYATWADWIAAMPADLTAADEVWIGEQLAETLAISTVLAITATTDSTRYIVMRPASSVPAAFHDGRSKAVSGRSNALIDASAVAATAAIDIRSRYVHVSDLEIIGPGANDSHGINVSDAGAASGGVRIFRNIIHADGANGDGGAGVRVSLANANVAVWSNIIYGFGSDGIVVSGASSTIAVVHNTCAFNCRNNTASTAQIRLNNASYSGINNACFEPGSRVDFALFSGSDDGGNASSDTTGSSGFTSLTTADQFINATDTWAQTDLRIKYGGALRDTALVVGSEYDTDCRRITRTGTWDIGAIEYRASSDGGDDDTFPGGDGDSSGLRYRRNFQRNLYNRRRPREHM